MGYIIAFQENADAIQENAIAIWTDKAPRIEKGKKKDTGAQREEPPEKKSEERWERRGEVRGERGKRKIENPGQLQKVKYTRKGQLESPGEFSPSP